ncbi:MAG TPA: addiction module protein [Pirellulales bacterium]
MALSLKQFGIDLLSADERAELIELIEESLADEALLTMPEAHRRLLEERLAAADAKPNAREPWSSVYARLLKKTQ